MVSSHSLWEFNVSSSSYPISTFNGDIRQSAMTVPDEVDVIVCGGGSCGCVVAGRLANLDHNLQVMLIEAG